MRESSAQSGFSAYVPLGGSVELGDLGELFPLLNSEFSIVLPIIFPSGKAVNHFLNANDGGGNSLSIGINVDDDLDGSLSFLAEEDSGDVREVKWAAQIQSHKPYWLRIVSSGPGAGNLNLHLFGADPVDILAETHDAGFNPTENLEFIIGDFGLTHAAVQISGPIMIFDRPLTATELVGIEAGRFPTDFIKCFPFSFPHIGLNEAI